MLFESMRDIEWSELSLYNLKELIKEISYSNELKEKELELRGKEIEILTQLLDEKKQV